MGAARLKDQQQSDQLHKLESELAATHELELAATHTASASKDRLLRLSFDDLNGSPPPGSAFSRSSGARPADAGTALSDGRRRYAVRSAPTSPDRLSPRFVRPVTPNILQEKAALEARVTELSAELEELSRSNEALERQHRTIDASTPAAIVSLNAAEGVAAPQVAADAAAESQEADSSERISVGDDTEPTNGQITKLQARIKALTTAATQEADATQAVRRACEGRVGRLQAELDLVARDKGTLETKLASSESMVGELKGQLKAKDKELEKGMHTTVAGGGGSGGNSGNSGYSGGDGENLKALEASLTLVRAEVQEQDKEATRVASESEKEIARLKAELAGK